MEDNTKKILLVSLGSAALFLLIKKVWPVKPKTSSNSSTQSDKQASFSGSTSKSTGTPEQREAAIIALKAYTRAVREGETPARLQQLNQLLFKEYKLKVYKDKKTGEYFCTDENGNPV